MNWQYFILGIIAYQIIKMLALAINREVIEYRQRKFIKLVQITFPDKKDVTFISVDSSDKRGMKNIERQLRETYNVPEDEEPVKIRNGDGYRN
jgi:hypothetical protein